MNKSVLIDLDGVLRIRNKPAADINELLEFLELNNIPTCILSNSSISSSNQVRSFFTSHSIKINIPIITAIDAAKNYIENRYEKVAAYTSENVIDIFADFLDYENPEAVLIGDIGDLWNYKLMQTIFEYIRNGAELIAAHKNKYWEKESSDIQLDAGPFIHAIEFASSKNATLIGKPSPLYFDSALKKLNSNLSESFIMIGDDLDSDIVGAKKNGAETILIFTGKTKPPIPSSYKKYIDHEAKNLNDVIRIIKKGYDG